MAKKHKKENMTFLEKVNSWPEIKLLKKITMVISMEGLQVCINNKNPQHGKHDMK